MEERVKKQLQDRTHLTQLKDTQKREKELLQKVAQLEEENRKLTAKKQSTEKLKKEFKKASQGLTAVDWFYKAGALWDGRKYTDPKKAIEYLNNAIKLQPDLAIAYNNRGLAYDDLGQRQRAIEDYNQAIRLKPDLADAYNNRGLAYDDLGQRQRAIEDYNQTIRLQPDYFKGYNNRGLAYHDLGQYQRAIEDYNQAIRLQPDLAPAYNNRAVVFFIQGNDNLGCRDAQKACAMGGCKALEWAKGKGLCRQEQDWKSREDEVNIPPADVSDTKSPVKQFQPPKKNDKPSEVADHSYKGIKGIVLINGTIVEGQILNISTNAVIIRTKDGKVLSYSLEKEVQTFIKE